MLDILEEALDRNDQSVSVRVRYAGATGFHSHELVAVDALGASFRTKRSDYGSFVMPWTAIAQIYLPATE